MRRNLRNRVFMGFCAVTNNSRKNPVSGHPRQSKKPGFFPCLWLSPTILAKTRFLATRDNLRNRVFSHVFGYHKQFSQKPGFWPPAQSKKPGFFPCLWLSPTILVKTRFLATRNLRNRVFMGFCAITNNFRKNPVSGHPRQSKIKKNTARTIFWAVFFTIRF